MNQDLQTILPKRGNRLTRRFGHACLDLLGWRFNGQLPDLPRQVVIVAPHTSNWDFIIGILAVFALDIKAHWIGKHTLFFPPLKTVMEWLGGIPVNRSVPNDLIQSTAERFSREEQFILGIAPEGTRRKVDKWKKGYYRIAVGAGVPITCAGLDYRTRCICFGPTILPTGDHDADFTTISQFYSGINGKHPEKFEIPGEK